ncbi:hypothetical protein C3V36_00530 [Lachnospiraceae bacterium oral taxon 500]|nr:hypothetical protein C3V36_00530 [Lachnospiraceae bacterium oral taxon 500]
MGGFQLLGIIVLVIGILCMVAEIFIPSFGVAGGVGFLAMTVGIIMMAQNFAQGLLYFAIMLVISVLFLILGYHFIGSSKIALKNNLNEDILPDYQRLIGKRGRSVTPLRPSGTIELEGERYDVLTKGEFIATNETVEVAAVENNRIFVGRI